MRHQALLIKVGARVRKLREAQGLSRRQLSEKCGVSERFLGQLESGRGNISLVRFADVSLALGIRPAELLEGTAEPNEGRDIVAFLGVRGAGKTTIGSLYAHRLHRPFIELDQRIEETAGLPLGQIFELHGQDYYHRLEREVLGNLIAMGDPVIIATGGSIVSHDDNFAMLRDAAHTVWLRARAEDHWDRVIRQGDQRPMAENPHAFAELRALLAGREPLYAAADHIVDTTGRSVNEVVDLVEAALGFAAPHGSDAGD